LARDTSRWRCGSIKFDPIAERDPAHEDSALVRQPDASTRAARAVARNHMNRILYLALCALVCVAPIVVVAIGMGWPVTDGMAAGIALLLIPILTYPAGVVGTVFFLIVSLTGITTLTEGMALAAPIFAGAGYLQWYVILPKVYSRKDRGSKSAAISS